MKTTAIKILGETWTVPRGFGNAHSKREWSDAPPKLVFYRGPLVRIAEEITE